MKNLIIVAVAFVSLCYSLLADDYSGLVKAEIYSNVEQIQRGSDFYVVLKLNIADDWHIYWKNPGDSGLPTEIKWETPDGVEAEGGLIWQVPEKIKWSDMITYGYSHTMYLVQKFKTTRISDDPSIEITAEVSWLVCKEKCVPQDTSLSIALKVGNTFIKSGSEKLVNELLASAPKTYNSKASSFDVDDNELSIDLLDLPEDLATVTDVYPITEGIVDNTKTPEIEKDENEVTAEFKLSPYLSEMSSELQLLILYKNKDGISKSYETKVFQDK